MAEIIKIFSLLLCPIWALANIDPIVDTKYGPVSGKSIILDDGAIIDSYLGVPFARVPNGDLRFTVSNFLVTIIMYYYNSKAIPPYHPIGNNFSSET